MGQGRRLKIYKESYILNHKILPPPRPVLIDLLYFAFLLWEVNVVKAWEEEEDLWKQRKVNLEEKNSFYDHHSGGKYDLNRTWHLGAFEGI